MRGGSWNNNARNCRSANRNNNDPTNTNNNNGFRVVVRRLAQQFQRKETVLGQKAGAHGFPSRAGWNSTARAWSRASGTEYRIARPRLVAFG